MVPRLELCCLMHSNIPLALSVKSLRFRAEGAILKNSPFIAELKNILRDIAFYIRHSYN